MSNLENNTPLWERGLHCLVFTLTTAIIIFAVVYGFMAVKLNNQQNTEMSISDDGVGAAKALPNFLIDDINSDDLEQLKP